MLPKLMFEVIYSVGLLVFCICFLEKENVVVNKMLICFLEQKNMVVNKIVIWVLEKQNVVLNKILMSIILSSSMVEKVKART